MNIIKGIIVLFFGLNSLSASQFISLDTLPRVFTVGEFGKQYEELVANCEMPLLELADRSMDSAYMYWLDVMSEFEMFADTIGFDIKGAKIWINIFWNPDGSVRHIVYFPKRSSRNINFNRLGIVLDSFSIKSKIELKSSECFSHFGSASFPTHADYILNR